MDGLAPEDEIVLAFHPYGGASTPTFQLACRVVDVGLTSISIDRDIPPHLVRYSSGCVVFQRSAVLPATSVGDAWLQPTAQGAIAGYRVCTAHFRIDIEVRMQQASPHVDVRTRTTFLQPCRLFNLSLLVRSPLAIAEVYLKNRTLRDVRREQPAHDIWLWKEGVRAGDSSNGWMILGNPSLASVELLTRGRGAILKTAPCETRPTLALNLLHCSAQHFRRHVENLTADYSHSAFEDMSLPAFERGAEVTHDFRVHLGGRLGPAPRLALVPHGFRAAHVWTEHADKTTLASHRAAYFGHEDIEKVEGAVGGFAKFGHVVTKSVFHDNPRAYLNRVKRSDAQTSAGEMLAYGRSPEFAALLDQLDAQGHEICLHAIAPDDAAPPERDGQALAMFHSRFGSRTWIDHGIQDVRMSIGWQGLLPWSHFAVQETLAKAGVRYFWTWSSTDFMARDKRIINLLHTTKGEHLPTPLWWRHPFLPAGLVWASHEAHLEAFTDAALDALIQERGISVHQHYYPFLVDDQHQFGFIEQDGDGKYVATARFNSVLRSVAERRASGELLQTTLGELASYWSDCEQVSIEMQPRGFTLHSGCANTIEGCAVILRARAVTSAGARVRSRALDDGDLLVWMDLPPNGRIQCDVEEHP
ncbi:hypothetical protein [Caenimonas sedimenti]|uniref:hypothetical protein n=1 Tax=Caenimonas sedimenti TaxID=2596921 RepID=UPI00164693BD|nr:hypothetical protein [Caenimonas sedimenti]